MFTMLTGSKLRGWLLAGLALAVTLGMTSVAQAQTTTPPAQGMSGTQIIFHLMDYTVVLILVLASVAGVAFIIEGLIHVRETRIAPVETTEHLRSLINARQFKELMDFTSVDQSFVSKALNAGLKRAHLGYTAMREATESAAGEQMANTLRRVEFLNIIGNIGPLLGLLGTVLGMIIAFYAMQEAGGNPKPGDLAGGIARALWHTFGGLFIAIPCLVAFGFLRTRADRICTQATLLTEELLESLRPSEKGAGLGESSAKAARRAPAPAAQPAVAEAAE